MQRRLQERFSRMAAINDAEERLNSYIESSGVSPTRFNNARTGSSNIFLNLRDREHGNSQRLNEIRQNQNQLFNLYSEAYFLQNRLQNNFERLQSIQGRPVGGTFDIDAIESLVEYLKEKTDAINNPRSTEVVNPTKEELRLMRESIEHNRSQDQEIREQLALYGVN